jgi:hypothetical protein
LKDESEKVRTLQKELEKYASCVTQVWKLGGNLIRMERKQLREWKWKDFCI